uniref:Uncharacterized protein n=1 Tax=Sphaerodactylus townsendi TaxID=933632 RepID=A0ACB8EJB4_9SAUR
MAPNFAYSGRAREASTRTQLYTYTSTHKAAGRSFSGAAGVSLQPQSQKRSTPRQHKRGRSGWRFQRPAKPCGRRCIGYWQ